MANINWDKYHIVTTALLNQIVIGKLGKDAGVILDKSDDLTSEAVTAVYQHMKEEFRLRKQKDEKIVNLEFVFGDGSKLVYEPTSDQIGDV